MKYSDMKDFEISNYAAGWFMFLGFLVVMALMSWLFYIEPIFLVCFISVICLLIIPPFAMRKWVQYKVKKEEKEMTSPNRARGLKKLAEMPGFSTTQLAVGDLGDFTIKQSLSSKETRKEETK